MSGTDVYQNALALIPADGYFTDYSPYVVRWVNALIAEAMPVENSIRISEGDLPLTSLPVITSAAEDIPCHDIVASYAMPRGMAAIIARDMDNYVLSNEFRSQYISALAEIAEFNTDSIENVY